MKPLAWLLAGFLLAQLGAAHAEVYSSDLAKIASALGGIKDALWKINYNIEHTKCEGGSK